jgi:hypothetical protein
MSGIDESREPAAASDVEEDAELVSAVRGALGEDRARFRCERARPVRVLRLLPPHHVGEPRGAVVPDPPGAIRALVSQRANRPKLA